MLNESFGFCFWFLSGADLQDKFEPKHQKMSSSHNWILKHLFFSFLVEFKISDTFENTFVNENSMEFLNNDFNIFSHVFQHEFFWFQNPVVWISDDSLKINIDDIFWIKQCYKNVKISYLHANFNEKKNW